MAATARARARRWGRANLLTDVLLVFPLFLVYQVGVLLAPEVYNGADFVTGELLRLMQGQIGAYVLLNLGLFFAFLLTVLVLRRRSAFEWRLFVPVVLESTVYAVCMGALIVTLMTRILHIDPRLQVAAHGLLPLAARAASAPGPFARVILSFGAGVHEELFFRLLLIPGLVAVGARLFGLRRLVAVLLAFFVSSVLFSAAHHVVGGEPWRIGVFVYRTLCGLFFATLFQIRGFAVAVYTHAIYDLFVLTLG